MNCSEFKKWTETATEAEILSANSNVLNHVNYCSSCSDKLLVLQSSISFMNTQKGSSFSDIKAKHLIDLLSEKSFEKQNKMGSFFLNRIAVAAIIIFGLLAGVVAGGLINSKPNTDNTIWSNEFTLLSDNSSTDSYVFD